MQQKQFSKFVRGFAQFSVAAIAVMAISLAACGGSTNSGSSGPKNLIIASELPVTGTDAGDGVPTQNGVQLAVSQNANLGNGYTLTFLSENDVSTTTGTHDPTTGANNIVALANNASVMGVVGPFNSNVAGAEIPVANRYGLTLISPSNTNPGLTLQQYAAANGFDFNTLHPAGKPDYYFRVCGNDIDQGKLDAKIATSAPINATTAFVIDDNEAYGVGLANFFTQYFQQDGGKTVGTRQSISLSQASTFPTLAQNIVNAHPGVIFYGGVTSNGAPQLKAQVDKAGGSSIPWVGGDGIADDPSWITQGGADAFNVSGTVAAPDISTLAKTNTVAQTFVQQYTAKFGAAPIPYSAMAYDAAMIEITAIKDLISAGKPVTRSAVRDEIAGLTYNGVTGTISFDSNGDNKGSKFYSIYYADPKTKQWVFETQIDTSTL